MRVLAIDTALAACSAAVFDTEQGRIFASESLPMTRGHAEALMPLMERVMADAVMAFSDIDRVAVTTGPGSFTGLRVGIAAARGIALAAEKPAVGIVDAVGLCGAASEPTGAFRSSPRSMRGTTTSIFRFSAPGGRTLLGAAAGAIARSGAGGGRSAGLHRRLGGANRRGRACRSCSADAGRPSTPRAAPDIAWVARIGAVVPEALRRRRRNICAPLTRSRNMPPSSRADDGFRDSSAGPAGAGRRRSAAGRDAAAVAALHAASFRRGWSEHEFARLIGDRNVVGHRTTAGTALVGFILSRLAADEAEILSVAIAQAWRGRGLSRPLLDLHLRRLAGLGVRTVFLEVGENNRRPAGYTGGPGFTRLAGGHGYYDSGVNALTLRRDLQ